MCVKNLTSIGLIMFTLAMGLGNTNGAEAKAACSEGRTTSGKCVKPFMAAAQRKIMVAFTQPKISQSSKLISSVAAPVQIAAAVQNVSVAQSSASTFEALRGPTSYQAQVHYNTTSIPESLLAASAYLTPAEFATIQTELINAYPSFSSLSATAQSYLISVYCSRFFTLGVSGASGLPYSQVPRIR